MSAASDRPGQGLVRGGFAPFELRIYTNSLVVQQTAGESDIGFEDGGVGAVDGLSGYAGVASYLGSGPDTNFIEAGLAYLSDADTQLDLNWGIDTDSRERFIGVGWARRWR